MPQNQGTSEVNLDYLNELKRQIQSVDICSDLQHLADEAIAEIKAQLAGLNLEMSDWLLVKELLTPPTDLGSILSWIENMINEVIKPLYQPYLTAIKQLTALATELTTLLSEIEAAASRIGSCSVTTAPPTITIPAIPT